MDIEKAKNLFPYLKTNKIYFNHAAIGPLSTPVVEKIKKHLKERSYTKLNNFDSLLENSKSAKKKLAQMFNCDPKRLAWGDNVANGMNLLAQGLDWQQGDRIILNDIEFPSNVYPFLNLQKQGVEVDFVHTKKGIFSVFDYEKLITPKTKLISVSAVQFLSGFRVDLKALGNLCKKHNIIFAVDSIQAAGAINIDVQQSNVDFMVGGTQKWLLGLTGLSYLFVSEKLQNKITQRNVGWASVNNPWKLIEYDLTLNPTAARYQTGTLSSIGIAAIDASLDIFLSFGKEIIEKKIISNSKYLIEQLSNIGIKPLLLNQPEKNIAGIVTFPTKNPKEILNGLKSKNITGEMRVEMIRLSPHFYNTKDEIDFVVETIKELI